MSEDRVSRPAALAVARYGGLALVGLAVLTLTAASGTVAALPHQGDLARTVSGPESARHVAGARPPFATRARARRVARSLLAKAVLPPGTRLYHGRRPPRPLRHPMQTIAADTYLNRHELFTGRRSANSVIAFLDHNQPLGMSRNGNGESYDLRYGRKFGIERYVMYSPSHLPWGFSEIDLLVQVIAGRHGHSWIRVDVQEVWYPRRSATERLVADHFRAVSINAVFYGTSIGHARRTFTQQAIIGKLTRVLNSLPASPGGPVSCPLITATYKLTFVPAKHYPGASVAVGGCLMSRIQVGGHAEPTLFDSGKIDKLIRRLLRSSPRAGGRPES